MPYRFSAVSSFAAAAVIVSMGAPGSSHAHDGPRLGDKILYTSDVQFNYTRSPDNKAISVAFDNFSAARLPGAGGGPVIRILPLRIPVADAGEGATLRIKTRGKRDCPGAAVCLAILWVNGQTQVLGLPPAKRPSDFSAEAELVLPRANVYEAVLVLFAERTTRGPAATISVASLDLAIAPPPAQTGTAKGQ
jgi:hypothetical protein